MALPRGERVERFIPGVIDFRRRELEKLNRIETPRPGTIEITSEEQYMIFDGELFDGQHFAEKRDWFCMIGEVPDEADIIKINDWRMLLVGQIISDPEDGSMFLTISEWQNEGKLEHDENPNFNTPIKVDQPQVVILQDGRVFVANYLDPVERLSKLQISYTLN